MFYFISYKIFIFIIFRISFTLFAALPGIYLPNNWKCLRDIIIKSPNEQISFKAALALYPNYLLKGKRKNNNSKIRVVFDAYFR